MRPSIGRMLDEQQLSAEVHWTIIDSVDHLDSRILHAIAANLPQFLVIAVDEKWLPELPSSVLTQILVSAQCRKLLVTSEDASDSLLERYRTADVDVVLHPFCVSEFTKRFHVTQLRSDPLPDGQSLSRRIAMQNFVGKSEIFIREVDRIVTFSECDSTVLIRGETGTGKELCARAIHYLSPRSGRPFVPLNCGAIPADLLENELFGHSSGAFTGALRSATGLIQESDGGTLFLDEVDSLTLTAQVKLLRFLQEGEYRTLGSPKTLHADVRIVAASNSDLKAAVRRENFRSDLFYRLNVLQITMPPLRDRKEDIPLMANHFLDKFNSSYQCAKSLEVSALRRLQEYSWPGNVRELANVIERAHVLCCGEVIRGRELCFDDESQTVQTGSFKELKQLHVDRFEREYLKALMARHKGNVSSAGREARKNRRALFELLKKHQIDVGAVRAANVENAHRG